MDNLENLGYQEQRVVMEDLVHQALRVHKVTKVTLDQMALQDLLEMMESMEREDHLDQKERRENLVFKEVLELEVLLE